MEAIRKGCSYSFKKTIFNFQEVFYTHVLDINIENQKLKGLKGIKSTVLMVGWAKIKII